VRTPGSRFSSCFEASTISVNFFAKLSPLACRRDILGKVEKKRQTQRETVLELAVKTDFDLTKRQNLTKTSN
jgi:hypothetical protein